MGKTTSALFIVIYSSVVILSFCIHAITADNIITSDNNEIDTDNVDRQRREADDLDDLKSEDKRQREFIGKRYRHFLGKRPDEYAFDDSASEDIDNDKRYSRHFLGKRGDENLEESDFDTPEKRMREFLGKRSYDSGEYYPDVYGEDQDLGDEDDKDKRVREFIGKRSYSSMDLSTLEKRLREYMGKRTFPYLRIGQNLFFRKPKYMREFIGKRSAPSTADNDINEEKRMREFIGKRMREFIGKRMREFIGKRSREFIGKRLREFVGK